MEAQGVWVCEYLSGGGLRDAPADDAGTAELLAAGTAMRDALMADLAALPGPAPRCADAASGRAPRAGETMLNFVRREAAGARRAWVVAPESDGLLAAFSEAVPASAWVGCTPEAIRLAASKRATLRHLAAQGVATPLAFAPQATAWVVKPDDGAGTQDTRRHASRAAADADLSGRVLWGRSATLEPWVDGEALSLSLLCGGAAGVELLSINRQRIALDDGGLLRDEGVAIRAIGLDDARAPALARLAHAVHGAIEGLRGFVGIDCVWHAEHGPVVIEVNPRLTCAYVGLSQALGRNLAGEILALHGDPHAVEALHAAA